MFFRAMELACNKKYYGEKADCYSELKPYLSDSSNDKVSKELIDGAKVKILVYFHGGLNTYEDSDKRMEKRLNEIEDKAGNPNENKDWHYPIYVSWPSNALGTIGEHWFSNREGRWTPWHIGVPSSPFIIFEDIVGSIAELPSNVYYQFTNDKDRFMSATGHGLSSIWKEAFHQYEKQLNENEKVERDDFHVASIGDNNNIMINRSRYTRQGLRRYFEAAGLTIMTPLRYPAGSIWNGALANSGWDMMKRRAINIFYPTGDFQKRLHERGLVGTHLGIFFQELFKLQKANPTLDIRLTLVGHSMGTIAIIY